MSVFMTLRALGDPRELERRAAENPAGMGALVDSALEHGLISHRFFGTDEGEIVVFDERETEAGFHAVLDSHPETRTMVGEVGVTAPPLISFWRKLESHDEV